MRNTIIFALGAFVATASAQAQSYFAPSPEQIAAVEAKIENLPQPLDRYARYYSGMMIGVANGEPIPEFFGRLRPLEPGEASIVRAEANQLGPLKAGGCILFRRLEPGHEGGYTICAEPGAWEPTESDIDDLERRLALPRGADRLNRYERYYAGITRSGERLILGELVGDFGAKRPTTRPGRYIISEVEFPLVADGGCYVIRLEYNPRTRRASVECNGF